MQRREHQGAFCGWGTDYDYEYVHDFIAYYHDYTSIPDPVHSSSSSTKIIDYIGAQNEEWFTI